MKAMKNLLKLLVITLLLEESFAQVTLRLVSERACSGQNLTFSCEAPTAETRILVWMITALPDVPAMPNSFGQSLGNTFERITSPDSIAGPNPSIITILNATAVDSGATVQCRIVNGDLSNVINLSIRRPECTLTVGATAVTDTSITVEWMWTNCRGAEPSSISLMLFPAAQDPIVITNQRSDITGLEPNTTYSIIASFTDACGTISAETIETTLPRTDTSDGDLLTQSTFLIAPLNLTTEAREKLPNASREKLYVCYRMHGVQGRTFSLLSHTWISINVQYYISVTVGMTHISAVGIILFDNGTAQCIKVVITAQQCSATINGKTASAGSLVIGQYQFEFTSTDKSMLIARQSRTNEFFPVVRVSCVPSRASVNQNNLYLYVSDTLPQSHGILGQLWNVPADVRPLSCGSHDLSVVTGRQIYEVVLHPNTTKERAIAGTWYPLTWGFSHHGPCIYAGNWFAEPNIIEGNWEDYIVTPENDLLASDFAYSKFFSLACGT